MDIVIGGGITGLSYACFSTNNTLVLEKDATVGGYCRTTRRNGYVWDYSGHFFHFRDAALKEWMQDGMSGETMAEVLKCTRIKYKELLVDYPFQKNIHQLDKEELIDCLYDLFNTGASDYGNFEEMLYCKFGRSIAEKFLIPYNEKLYACQLNRLDKDAMGRFFPYAEKEEIIRNFKHHNNQSYNARFVYPHNGAVAYVDSVCRRIDPRQIRTEAEVQSIDVAQKQVWLRHGEVLSYDHLISTLPFPELLSKAGIDYDQNIYTWNQVLVFNLGFDKKGPDREDHWLYFPERDYCFYRVGFYDNILGTDRMSLYVEIGFDRHEQIHPHEWLGRVLADLAKAGITAPGQQLADYESLIMNPAYVHISADSISDVSAKKAELARHDIYSIGRYGSWTYCSIEDNIKEAQALAQKLQ